MIENTPIESSKLLAPDKIKLSVYLDDGRVFEYFVDDAMKGREHASAIIKTGYRHSHGTLLEWYPPHRILKVVVPNGSESTKYQDSTRAT